MKKIMIPAINRTPNTTPTTIPAIAPFDNEEAERLAAFPVILTAESLGVGATVLVVVIATVLLL